MQHIKSNTFALAIADAMIADRFSKTYGVSTFSEYLDLVDSRATAHLSPSCALQVLSKTGKQRRLAVLNLEHGTNVTISIPMNDPAKGTKVWATTELATWLDVIEAGADGAWMLNYGGGGSAPNVRTVPPLVGSSKATLATISRIIVNAKAGQQARTSDGNPLNLRRGNLYIVGQPQTREGAKGSAKRDTRKHIQAHAQTRAKLAGSNFEIPTQWVIP
jgi:hypothetical protein